MSTSILLIPESPNWQFPVDQAVRLVLATWPTATAHRLPTGPYDFRIEVPDRSMDIRVGRGSISMSPGPTADDCAVVAHRLVRGLGAPTRFHYMDSGNNHALLVDQRTPLSTFTELSSAGPL